MKLLQRLNVLADLALTSDKYKHLSIHGTGNWTRSVISFSVASHLTLHVFFTRVFDRPITWVKLIVLMAQVL